MHFRQNKCGHDNHLLLHTISCLLLANQVILTNKLPVCEQTKFLPNLGKSYPVSHSLNSYKYVGRQMLELFIGYKHTCMMSKFFPILHIHCLTIQSHLHCSIHFPNEPAPFCLSP